MQNELSLKGSMAEGLEVMWEQGVPENYVRVVQDTRLEGHMKTGLKLRTMWHM